MTEVTNIAAQLYRERFGRDLTERVDALAAEYPLQHNAADFTEYVVTELGNLTRSDIVNLYIHLHSTNR